LRDLPSQGLEYINKKGSDCMRKAIIVICLSWLVLSACSNQPKDVSAVETIKSEGLNITEINSPKETELDGIKPVSYKLDNNEIIIIYDFGSTEKQELGQKHFQEHQQILSSHAPIVYQASKYLILYYSNVNSTTQTPKLSETKFGEKIKKAIKRIQ
jgi:hypothetical protein